MTIRFSQETKPRTQERRRITKLYVQAYYEFCDRDDPVDIIEAE